MTGPLKNKNDINKSYSMEVNTLAIGPMAIGPWETHYIDLPVWQKINLTQSAISRHEQ